MLFLVSPCDQPINNQEVKNEKKKEYLKVKIIKERSKTIKEKIGKQIFLPTISFMPEKIKKKSVKTVSKFLNE